MNELKTLYDKSIKQAAYHQSSHAMRKRPSDYERYLINFHLSYVTFVKIYIINVIVVSCYNSQLNGISSIVIYTRNKQD